MCRTAPPPGCPCSFPSAIRHGTGRRGGVRQEGGSHHRHHRAGRGGLWGDAASLRDEVNGFGVCCAATGVSGVPAELAAVFPRESSAQVSAELYQEAAAPAGGSARGWGSPSSWSCQRGAAGQPASWAVPLLPITCPRPSLQSASLFHPGCMMQTAPEAACFAFLQVRHSPCLIFGWVNHRVRSVA